MSLAGAAACLGYALVMRGFAAVVACSACVMRADFSATVLHGVFRLHYVRIMSEQSNADEGISLRSRGALLVFARAAGPSMSLYNSLDCRELLRCFKTLLKQKGIVVMLLAITTTRIQERDL